MSEQSWYSDDALRKQAEVDRLLAAGAPVPVSLMAGIYAPRVRATESERCRHCDMDAREEAGGVVLEQGRFCGLCWGRDRYEDYPPATAPRPTEVECGEAL